MNSISERPYRKLRQRLRALDYQGFNRALEEITGRSKTYICQISRGERNFNRFEMDKILAAIGEESTSKNYLDYFPTLGINPELDIHDQAIDLIRKAFGGIA